MSVSALITGFKGLLCLVKFRFSNWKPRRRFSTAAEAADITFSFLLILLTLALDLFLLFGTFALLVLFPFPFPPNVKRDEDSTAGDEAQQSLLTVDGIKRIKEKDIKGTELKLTKDRCLLTFDDDPSTWRVLMPCGHAFTPGALTSHLYDYFKLTRSVILCPRAETEQCEPWPYVLVRQAAMLTNEECKYFETLCGRNWLFSTWKSSVECPQCHSFGSNDRALERVVCLTCHRAGRSSDFCSRCRKPWEALNGCCKTCSTNYDLINETLANAPTKEIGPELKNIPKWRSCPRWEDHPYPVLIEHTVRCKHIPCPNCKKWFCFVCLAKQDTSEAYPCGGAYSMCPSGIAPPQIFKRVT